MYTLKNAEILKNHYENLLIGWTIYFNYEIPKDQPIDESTPNNDYNVMCKFGNEETSMNIEDICKKYNLLSPNMVLDSVSL